VDIFGWEQEILSSLLTLLGTDILDYVNKIATGFMKCEVVR
jgi:hypothetical protein